MSANNDEKYRVWDSLWQDNRLLSVGVEKNPDIAANFEAHWKSTVDALEPGARVLDLACGNGHVALTVAQALHVSETSGQGRDPTQYLQKFSAEVERVMAGVSETNIGPVAAVISTLQDVLTRRKTMKIADQLAVIEKLKTRLTEYASRNETTTKAALGDASLDALVRGLSSAGVKGLRPEPRAVGALGTVAWTVST